MLCNCTPTGWEVVYQNAHARLAADLLRPVRADRRPARWDALLFATALHDNGWQEWEPGDHRTALGTPRPFEETTVADVVRQSEMALRRVQHASLFAALLVAEHYRSLYGRVDDDAVRDMLKAQTERRARWRRVLGVRQAEVAAHYAPLRWADTLSLFLCGRTLPIDGLRVEVGPITEGATPTFVWQRADGTVGMDPWPYADDRVTVGVETYTLAQLTFATDAALADALDAATAVPVAWTLTPR